MLRGKDNCSTNSDALAYILPHKKSNLHPPLLFDVLRLLGVYTRREMTGVYIFDEGWNP